MNLKVGELEETLAKRQETSKTTKLGNLKVTEDATEITYTDGLSESWALRLDETANHALAKYLKIPTAYYDRLGADGRAWALRYEFERNKDADTTFELLNDDVVAVHTPSQVMMPLTKVTKVIEKVFSPEDTVRRMVTNESRFHVDVTSANHQLVVPVAGVGDITEAGVRFLAYPFSALQPSVGIYTERLVCMNGQTTDERLGKISLKGRTVDEVLLEMEEAAQLVLGNLDDYLERINSTRQVFAPGSPQAFAAQLAREAGVKREVLDKVLDIINQLGESQPVSVWDVQNAFTSVANEVSSYKLMTKLQTLGGALSFDTEKMVERCGTCERRL